LLIELQSEPTRSIKLSDLGDLMRRALTIISILILSLLSTACGEHGIEIDFPTEAISVIPVQGEASFASQDWSANATQASVRLHGVVLAPLKGHPPEDRAALDLMATSAVREHEQHVTRAVIAHVERTLEMHGRDDLKWTSTRVLGSATPMKIESSALQVRYAYELHLRAETELYALLIPNQRVDPSLEIEVGESWWGDSESTATLKVEEAEAPDGFLPYPTMVEDGAIDIAIHVGAGADIDAPAEARIEEAGLSLLANGWKHPSTANFGQLEVGDLPFTREATFGGQTSELRVMLISESFSAREAAPRLSNALVTSLMKRDVVILRDLEPALEEVVAGAIGLGAVPGPDAIEVSAGAQLVILHRTSDRPWADQGVNAVRATSRRDVLEFARTDASEDAVLDALITGLTLTDGAGRHVPLSVAGLHRLAARHAGEALHLTAWGLQHNATLNPYGTHDHLGGPCTGPSTCGAPGNLCVSEVEGQGACGLACASDTACPTGYRCAAVAMGSDLDFLPRQCVPRPGPQAI
jgi:hypothetical protein